MKPTTHLATAGILAITTILSAPLDAQDIVLSEIHADAGSTWVEIYNRGGSSVDLSSWSLYYSTDTVSMPQNYWWAFEPGTTLAPDSYLRVFWFQNPPPTTLPGDYYTGTSPYGYLFTLGGEMLHGSHGAFALLSTQVGSNMATASYFTDWVSWGQAGFARESLAVQNSVWTTGSYAPAIPAGQSLARNTAVIGQVPTHEQEWFLDPTPTPMAVNISGMIRTSYGQACTVAGHHLIGLPVLTTTSLPILGNAQFGFVVSNTTGFFGESMLMAWSTSAAPTGQPSLLPRFSGSTCEESINTGEIFATTLLSTRITQTTVPMSLANLPAAMAGLELHSQALVFDWLPNAFPPFQGISNALMIVIGQ